MLNILRNGDGAGVPLVVAHGLFGSARNWGVLSKRLSDRGAVLTVDMRNHGDSDWRDSHRYDDLAGDLAEVIEHTGGPADLLGHSMGGKAAMVLALSRPDIIGRLIVADIAPVAYRHSQAPLITAMQRLNLDGITRRSEADQRLVVTVEDPATRAFLLQSLDLKTTPPRWKLNLDVLARDMPDIVGFPDMSGQFDGPALFVTGGNSDYVQTRSHDRIRELFPKAEFQSIDGAGHWLHAEQPRAFEAAIREFLMK